MPGLPYRLPSIPSGFTRRLPSPAWVRVCVCVERGTGTLLVWRPPPPSRGRLEEPWVREGLPLWERFGDSFAPSPPTPPLNNPERGRSEAWMLWDSLPRPPRGQRGPLGAAAGSGKEALVPRTHPLLLGTTVRPGALRRASRLQPFLCWNVVLRQGSRSLL